jgi:carbamate kinase
LDHLSAGESKKYLSERQFCKDSMGPKIMAVLNFLEQGGKRALITNPENMLKALNGGAGTEITAWAFHLIHL